MSTLDDMIARLRELPDLAERVADDIAAVIDEELQRTIAAGTTPEGKPWERTKQGKQPLQYAGRPGTLNVASVGRVIYVRLTGPEARHHTGRARGQVRRQIIPRGQLPPAIAAKVEAVIARHLSDALGPGGGPP